MPKYNYFVWFVLLLLILFPTVGGKILFNIAGSFILVIVTIPILLSGIGWITWRLLRNKIYNCTNCGAINFGNGQSCSVCGSSIGDQNRNKTDINDSIPASEVTIDISSYDPSEQN